VIEHPHVNHDLLVLAAGAGLELHAHPAVAFVVAAKAARRHRVGERKERRAGAARTAETLEIQTLLVLEHRLEALAAHVTCTAAVDRVAHLHVVRGDALGDRARRAAGAEKPPHDFLPCADLGEGAVETRVEVDLERFLPRIHGMVVHVAVLRPRPVRDTCRLRSNFRAGDGLTMESRRRGHARAGCPSKNRRAAGQDSGSPRRSRTPSASTSEIAVSPIRYQPNAVSLWVRPINHSARNGALPPNSA